ncbi:23 kDa integral membrane protein isoform X6 [Bombyx mori]|uniref:23 kDa integral membrane protein isoform X6 n=1 Tax=Bombyx mori TaxID=7091 RepID=UPI002ED5C18B
MCCPEFIAKYVLFIANLVFSLAGLAIIRLGVAVLRNLRDLQDILPVNALPIGIIVLGCIIFIIAFLACCGAIKESRCMLITYSIFMVILVAVKIYLAIVVFGFLSDVTSTITSWVTTAFNTSSLRDVYHVMEALFNCCGTTGPSSYDGILSQLPPSCCASPVDNTFYAPNAFPGCTTRLIDYFDTFGRAIGSVLIIIIFLELVAARCHAPLTAPRNAPQNAPPVAVAYFIGCLPFVFAAPACRASRRTAIRTALGCGQGVRSQYSSSRSSSLGSCRILIRRNGAGI